MTQEYKEARLTEEEIAGGILDAPCIFCGYNGEGYWQKHTHREDCPFYEIGGEVDTRKRRISTLKLIERLDVLNNDENPKITEALMEVEQALKSK